VALLLPAVVGASVVDPTVGVIDDGEVAVPVGDGRSVEDLDVAEVVAETSSTEPWKEQPHSQTAARTTPPTRTDIDVIPPR
jgi:hypothetical protein